ncbi:MAG: beta-glucosidase [Acidimicrobiales bacterium]|jgi:beta-glucosidase
MIESGAFFTDAEVCGVAPQTDWSRWIDHGGAPPSDVGNGFRVEWLNDFSLVSELGFRSVAITLEWARLEPAAGDYQQGEVEHLRSMLQGARDTGLGVTACLVDGTLPGWFAVDEHGFVDNRSRTHLWPRHVEWIGETFGDLVDGWLPQREPIHHAVRNQLLAMGPPGRHDSEDTAKAVRAALLADGEAWRVLAGSSPVATSQTARQFVPEREIVPAKKAVDRLDGLFRHSWIGALASGVIEVPGLPAMDAPQLRDAFDIIVLHARPAVGIDAESAWSPLDAGFLLEGMATPLHELAEHAGDRQLHVAADVAPVDDDGEAQSDHLQGLRAEAVDAGATRWWQTSPIDGWAWERGFDGRGGILDADRKPKAAAAVFGTG